MGAAVDGVVVAEVPGAERDDLRDLAVALRDRPGIKGVVLGSRPGTGRRRPRRRGQPQTAGSTPAALIADAARTVGGGGGKAPDLAVAGGKDPSRLAEALDQARAAAGLPLGLRCASSPSTSAPGGSGSP